MEIWMSVWNNKESRKANSYNENEKSMSILMTDSFINEGQLCHAHKNPGAWAIERGGEHFIQIKARY